MSGVYGETSRNVEELVQRGHLIAVLPGLPSSLLVRSSRLEWKRLTVMTSVVYRTLVVLNKFLVSQFQMDFHHILYQSAEYS